MTGIDAVAIGETARDLVLASGSTAGVRIIARSGTRVEAGAPLAEIAGDPNAGPRIAAAFAIGEVAPPAVELVAAIVRDAAASPVSNAVSR